MNYYRLDLFKEITIGTNHCIQMILETLARLSDGLLV